MQFQQGVVLSAGDLITRGGGRLAGDAHLFFDFSGGRQMVAVEDAGLKVSDRMLFF